jgi:hypothetical protein
MMWRLNFLVFFACVVLDNSYMLYYICPMHTLFTVMVYAVLAIAPKLNHNNTACLAKCVHALRRGRRAQPGLVGLPRLAAHAMGTGALPPVCAEQ